MERSSTPNPIQELDQELGRLRRRAGRQKGRITASTEAWQQWSSTMDEALRVVAQLVTAATVDMEDLSVKFGAILWAIETNESLLDAADLRRLKAFHRELRRFAQR